MGSPTLRWVLPTPGYHNPSVEMPALSCGCAPLLNIIPAIISLTISRPAGGFSTHWVGMPHSLTSQSVLYIALVARCALHCASSTLSHLLASFVCPCLSALRLFLQPCRLPCRLSSPCMVFPVVHYLCLSPPSLLVIISWSSRGLPNNYHPSMPAFLPTHFRSSYWAY